MRQKWRRWIGCFFLCGMISLQGIYGDFRAQDIQSVTEENAGENVEEVTEEYGLSRKEIRQSVTDAVYEKEVRERADPAYTAVDEVKLVNAVLVKQSLFDGSLVEEGDTIDSIMGAIEQGNDAEGEKFLTQISNVVALYELSEESDYYVAYVNTMESDKSAEVRDFIFAEYDNEGHVLSDCIYDPLTGLAYIPKTDCINEEGEQIVLNVQVQLMQIISFGNSSSEILTSVREAPSSVSVYTSEAEIFDVETSVITEKGLKEEDMTVAVNGIPIQEEYYAYDPETGELSLNQSPAMIQSVSVSQEDSKVEKLADLLSLTNEVYALTAEQMTAVASNLVLPDWVTSGTLLVGSANYSYNGNSEWTYSYGFGINDEVLLNQMISLIEYGGSLDMSRVKSQYGSDYITTFVDLKQNTLMNNGRTIPGLKNIPVLHMECCHANTPLGSVSGSAVNGGKWSLQPMRLRFLNVDRAKGYAIIGIYTIETHTQTGCAFFKVQITPPYGYGNIGKKDAQSQSVLSGAVYQVYTDPACTKKAVDYYGASAVFTTVEENPFSNTITFLPGTYYVKEVKSPLGYSMDTTVKILNIYAGERTWANNAGNKTGWNFDNRQIHLMLQKVSSDENITKENPCYGLDGAVYGVYQSASDALTDDNRKATLQTDASGSTNSVLLDAGTYYVKELTASPGYGICMGKHDLADEQGIHVVDAVQYGQTYSITCSEPVLGVENALQLRKWDLDTKNPSAQGSASFADAIFRVEYFANILGDCSNHPVKTWYYKTDEKGVILCKDASYLIPQVWMGDQLVQGETELFRRSDNKDALLPLGTYRITEIQAPVHYQLKGKIGLGQDTGNMADLDTGKILVAKEVDDQALIYDGSQVLSEPLTVEQMSVNIYDSIYRGRIQITKKDTYGRPISGVAFRLKAMTSGEESVLITDQDGIIVWENLIPQEYEVSEIQASDGTSLLKEPVKVQLPLEISEDEISEDMDLRKAIWEPAARAYCFYNLNYEITNHGKLDMPVAGGKGYRPLIWPVIGAGFFCIGFFVWKTKRKNTL